MDESIKLMNLNIDFLPTYFSNTLKSKIFSQTDKFNVGLKINSNEQNNNSSKKFRQPFHSLTT